MGETFSVCLPSVAKCCANLLSRAPWHAMYRCFTSERPASKVFTVCTDGHCRTMQPARSSTLTSSAKARLWSGPATTRQPGPSCSGA